MARVLVAYFSQTGNTESVARAIHEETMSAGHDGELKTVADIEATTLPEYDLVFLGSACHSASLAKPVLELLGAIPPGSRLKVAGFATHSCAAPERGERDRELYEKWASGCPRAFETASEEARLELLGYFGCQGAASPQIEEFIHSAILPNEDEWQPFVKELRTHPDAGDLNDARQFARRALAHLSDGSQ